MFVSTSASAIVPNALSELLSASRVLLRLGKGHRLGLPMGAIRMCVAGVAAVEGCPRVTVSLGDPGGFRSSAAPGAGVYAGVDSQADADEGGRPRGRGGSSCVLSCLLSWTCRAVG